ncbi:MAG: hypothetical protein LLG45_04765 [Actinomycetia bacterium]|nr:hypothetical protein [Actinomycetes bacterium]
MRQRLCWVVAALVGIALLGAPLGLAGCGSQAVDQIPVQPSYETGSPATTAEAPSSTSAVSSTSSSAAPTSSTSRGAATLQYRNTDYGFSFSLPESWAGYSIVIEQWEGVPVDTAETASGSTAPHGPKILIRHPEWTATDPRQDIPIMIFTTAQWALVQQERLSVGAAPIPPTELGHNATYVFALPARYNYAFPTGYEEVEKILAAHPLKAF